jgi:type IV secretory pathway component VirB8
MATLHVWFLYFIVTLVPLKTHKIYEYDTEAQCEAAIENVQHEKIMSKNLLCVERTFDII